MIDTLKFAKKLEAAGVERRQAEAYARVFDEMLAEHLRAPREHQCYMGGGS
jgi:hypothetical protein